MADYSYHTDPQFLQADDATKHQYLMKNEPEYAKAPPEVQGRYRNSLRAPGEETMTNYPESGTPENTAWNRLKSVAHFTGDQAPEKALTAATAFSGPIGKLLGLGKY